MVHPVPSMETFRVGVSRALEPAGHSHLGNEGAATSDYEECSQAWRAADEQRVLPGSPEVGDTTDPRTAVFVGPHKRIPEGEVPQ